MSFTHSYLLPPNMHLRLLPSHAEDVVQKTLHDPKLLASSASCRSHISPRHTFTLLILVRIRIKQSYPLQAQSPKGWWDVTLFPSSLQRQQSGSCRAASRAAKRTDRRKMEALKKCAAVGAHTSLRKAPWRKHDPEQKSQLSLGSPSSLEKPSSCQKKCVLTLRILADKNSH